MADVVDLHEYRCRRAQEDDPCGAELTLAAWHLGLAAYHGGAERVRVEAMRALVRLEELAEIAGGEED